MTDQKNQGEASVDADATECGKELKKELLAPP
jgi:hypothetical protein